jgi:hypothetical protein
MIRVFIQRIEETAGQRVAREQRQREWREQEKAQLMFMDRRREWPTGRILPAFDEDHDRE